jgi:hypothetical protein
MDGAAMIDALSKRIDQAGLKPSALSVEEMHNILHLAATQGADAADEIRQLTEQESELAQIRLELLTQLPGAAAVSAVIYENQIKAGLAEGDERLAQVESIFSRIYGLAGRR